MKKILVIDDEKLIIENLFHLLTMNDYEVHKAKNGKEGFFKALQIKPDLIICDVMMPEMTGIDVLKLVRQNSEIRNTPFVFLTAVEDRKKNREAMNFGADDYLTKPFSMDELLDAVRSRLKRVDSIETEINRKIDLFKTKIKTSTDHEFNTPLNGIFGYTDLLLNYYENLDKEKIFSFLHGIKKSTRRLQKTLNDILLYNAIQTIDSDIAVKQRLTEGHSVIYGEVVSIVCDKLVQKYQRTNDFTFSIEKAELNISQDNLTKIIEELVDNAFKFSSDNTPVNVSGRNIDKKHQLRINDKGRGISPEHIKSIGAFCQFERTKYEQQGNGLGLYLAKTLVEINGGIFSIESDYGEGTEIVITFPIKAR